MTVTARQFFLVERYRADPAAEAQFFSTLKMRNGTFKLTQPSRFANMEAEIGARIAERAAHLKQVLDVGVSTGHTTIELADFLRAKGASAAVIGTDLFIQAHLIEISPRFRVFSDSDGWPLQYDLGGRPIRAWIRRLDYVTLMVAPRLLARWALRSPLRRKIAEGRSLAVSMETPGLAERNIELVENDIFVATPRFVGRFDFIRAANILNLNYFPAPRIRVALRNMRTYCRPGALMLVARSRGPQHHGTLFELKPDGTFAVCARVGDGSEIESLVLDQERNAVVD